MSHGLPLGQRAASLVSLLVSSRLDEAEEKRPLILQETMSRVCTSQALCGVGWQLRKAGLTVEPDASKEELAALWDAFARGRVLPER
jgi:hypothetical protein